MKKSLLHLLIAVLIGAPVSFALNARDWATTASRVEVSLNYSEITTAESAISKLSEPSAPDGFPEAMKKTKADKFESNLKTTWGTSAPWYVVNIPVLVHARGTSVNPKQTKTVPARFIKELNVTAYLLFKKPKTSKAARSAKTKKDATVADMYYLLKKDITYVNIPTKDVTYTESGQEIAEAEFCVGLFISRAANFMLTGGEDKEDDISKPDHLVGYAIEATFNGELCRSVTKRNNMPKGSLMGSQPGAKLFDKELIRQVKDAPWWKERSKNNFAETQAEALCISETPFAAFYGRYYPQTKPTYGPSVGASSSSADSAAAPSDSTAPTLPSDGTDSQTES